MMRVLVVSLALAGLALTACGGGVPEVVVESRPAEASVANTVDAGEPVVEDSKEATAPLALKRPTVDRHALLEDTAVRFHEAFIKGEYVYTYSQMSAGYRSECTLAAYMAAASYMKGQYEIPVSQARYVLDETRIEGDVAWDLSRYEAGAETVAFGLSETPRWSWENDGWVAHAGDSKDGPCRLG